MLTGDPSSWLKHFRDIEQRFVERLAIVWPQCLGAIGPTTGEDKITMKLVLLLKQDGGLRDFGILDFQHALLDEDCVGDPVLKGFIDIALLIEDDVYVAFECKRLNMIWKGQKNSLAGPYVDEGMMRFISAKYAERLPFGAMLGYVMDGDTVSADSSVRTAMDKRKVKLCLIEPVAPSSAVILHRLETQHTRPSDSNAFEIRHTLLSL